MRVLVACEESQRVCTAFRNKGHEAYSCDILECSGGHPEWHIQGDVLKILNPSKQTVLTTRTGDDSGVKEWEGITFTTMDGKLHVIEGRWDMIIAFPPCTHLAVSGALRFAEKREDGRQRDAIIFFCSILSADCDKIVVENPVNIISGKYCKQWFPDLVEKYGLPIKPSQSVHPWMFGHPESKKTCFWIKGVSCLVPTDILELPECGYWSNQTKDGQNKLIVDGKWIAFNDPRTATLRSKTYFGIAQAMADQWGTVQN